MNSPTKSAPMTGGQLTPEDAERFAAMFKPIWELDDAPFAPAKPGAITGRDVQQLGRAGVHADVQLASNGTAAAAGPHAPPPAHHAPMEDGSIVLDIQPEPPPQTPQMRPQVPQHVQQVVHAIPQPQQQPPAQRAPQSQRPRRSAPPPAVRHAMAADSGEFAPPKKSNVGIYAVIGVVALVAAGGIAYKVVGSNKTDDPSTKAATTSVVTHEEPRIPPPPPVVDTTPAATTTSTATTSTATTSTATTAKTAETVKPVDTTPAVTAPPATTVAAAKPTATPKPPPTVHTATTTKPTGKPGGGIVRDNPF